jgi:uncharacterized protein DUF1203
LEDPIMKYRVLGLSPDQFRHLFDMSDDELARHGAVRRYAEEARSIPCRVSLTEADLGDELLLITYPHHETDSPYRSAGPIYVRRQAETAYDAVNELPAMQLRRLSSVRGYDAAGFLVEADVAAGPDLELTVLRFFENADVDLIHVHNARPGCFAFRVVRA